jgi:hypothetical protein
MRRNPTGFIEDVNILRRDLHRGATSANLRIPGADGTLISARRPNESLQSLPSRRVLSSQILLQGVRSLDHFDNLNNASVCYA